MSGKGARFLLLVVAVPVIAAVEQLPDPPPWHVWKARHSKSYSSASEEEARRVMYNAEADSVRRHNARFEAGLETWTQAVNEHADLSRTEWAARVGLRRLPGAERAATRNLTWLAEPLSGPGAVDWRAKGAVTAVKNQGQCGSCWSFGATGTMEGAWQISGHRLVALSEQQLVDCSGEGCRGGNPGHAIAYVVGNRGIDSERDYPYTARDGRCNSRKSREHVAAFRGVGNVPGSNERQLLAAVARQPVAVAIDAEHGGFMSYHSGVMGGKCGDAVDHSVLVVGYGDEVFPPPPPPGPTVQCGQPRQIYGCYNVSGKAVLPTPARSYHDRLSLENCAAQCVALNLTVAGIDAGNHCNCGDLAALAAGASWLRPAAECQASNCTATSGGCVCRDPANKCPCDEKCGGAARMLAYQPNCTVTPPPPQPSPPPPRVVPYWIVKNSWGAGYGERGYIRMQRGVGGSRGLCCINCMPQYAISIKGPPPVPPPPPAPPAICSVVAGSQGCYNDTATATLLPRNAGGEYHDRLTLENCGGECWDGGKSNDSIAGIDAGNHCLCGPTGSLGTPEAAARKRPATECQAANCTGDDKERCGGTGRLLTYTFHCTLE